MFWDLLQEIITISGFKFLVETRGFSSMICPLMLKRRAAVFRCLQLQSGLNMEGTIKGPVSAVPRSSIGPFLLSKNSYRHRNYFLALNLL